MATVVLSEQANDDLAHIFEFIAKRNPAHASRRVQTLMDGLHILQTMPLIGRALPDGRRELLLGKRPEGFLARYRYVSELDTIFVLTIESQRRN